jgi:hypothetical protein
MPHVRNQLLARGSMVALLLTVTLTVPGCLGDGDPPRGPISAPRGNFGAPKGRNGIGEDLNGPKTKTKAVMAGTPADRRQLDRRFLVSQAPQSG